MDKFKDLFSKVKVRKFPDKNYHAIWNNLKTVRLGRGIAKELEPDRAEFYDVSLGNICRTGKCDFCLVPDTLIKTQRGDIPIIDIKENDLVYSFNENTNNIELKKVDQLFKREYNGELIELQVDGRVLRLTPNHKVYTQNRGYIEASNLQLDDTILIF